MPIRKRKVVSARAKPMVRDKVEWPFPPGVGEKVPQEFRRFHIPQDDYYYLCLPIRNTQEEHKDNLRRIGELGLPFQYAMSPSGTVCYRIHRRHKSLLAIQMEENPSETVSIGVPGVQFGKKVMWRMQQQNQFPYLYKTWEKVPVLRRIRERKR